MANSVNKTVSNKNRLYMARKQRRRLCPLSHSETAGVPPHSFVQYWC